MISLYLNESEFSRQIYPLLFSYLGIIFTEYNYQNQAEFECDEIQSEAPIPFLPLLKFEDNWIFGGAAICEFACNFKDREDLLANKNKVEFICVMSVCEDLINILTNLEGFRKRYENINIIKQEICPILSKFNMILKEKKFLFLTITLADFYLYVILIKINEIYENTFQDYCWLQMFKMTMNFFLSDKIINTLSPNLKTIRNEIIGNKANMENSEIFIDGKIPLFEKNNDYRNETELWKALNFIPESLHKSINMTVLDKQKMNYF